jgi:hypothetical protein
MLTDTACIWVDAYKRMHEVKVAGFCRNKDKPDESGGD